MNTPRLRPAQRIVLVQLAATGEFMPVDAHPRTIATLLANDWITETVHLQTGHTLYKITGRGKKRLTVRRASPMCGTCKCRPRLKKGAPCRECQNAYQRKRTATARSAKPCAACGVNTRRVYASGRQSSYCADCVRVKRVQFALQREVKPCPECGLRLQHVGSTGTRAYCLECLRRVVKRQRLMKGRFLYER